MQINGTARTCPPKSGHCLWPLPDEGGGRPSHEKSERRRKCPPGLCSARPNPCSLHKSHHQVQKSVETKRYDSCNTTGTLSPGFNRGRPLVLTTTFPHSPEAGKPPIWRG